MSKVKGDYWIVDDKTVKLQIKTSKEQYKLEEVLSGWQCVSYGYAPKTSEDIYVCERTYESELDLKNFFSSEKITSLIEMKEV